MPCTRSFPESSPHQGTRGNTLERNRCTCSQQVLAVRKNTHKRTSREAEVCFPPARDKINSSSGGYPRTQRVSKGRQKVAKLRINALASRCVGGLSYKDSDKLGLREIDAISRLKNAPMSRQETFVMALFTAYGRRTYAEFVSGRIVRGSCTHTLRCINPLARRETIIQPSPSKHIAPPLFTQSETRPSSPRTCAAWAISQARPGRRGSVCRQ